MAVNICKLSFLVSLSPSLQPLMKPYNSEIENHGNSTSYLSQRLTLANATEYSLKFQYAKLFTNGTQGGIVVVTYGGQVIYQQDLASRGQGWYTGSVNFTSAAMSNVDGTKLLNIGVVGRSNSTNATRPAVAQIGFDGITLRVR